MSYYLEGTIYRRCAPRRFPTRLSPVADVEIISLWENGSDTYDIAVALGQPESEIERRLHHARDLQKRNQEWNWPPERTA